MPFSLKDIVEEVDEQYEDDEDDDERSRDCEA